MTLLFAKEMIASASLDARAPGAVAIGFVRWHDSGAFQPTLPQSRQKKIKEYWRSM
jgi:hypothetical protein